MAKRFTDTAKWKKEFIKGLEAKYKLLWFYILDDCDHAGIWEVDFEVASLRIGEQVNYNDSFIALGSQIEVVGKNRWFIKDFIFFQYGELKETNRMHQSVIAVLNKHNIKINKPLICPLEGAKDKDKDKEQDKDKVIIKKESEKFQDALSDLSETLTDVESWTEQVIQGNDQHFFGMARSLNVNGELERLARDHLTLCSRYKWHENMKTQQAFRNSLLGHITKELKTSNDKRPNKKFTIKDLE